MAHTSTINSSLQVSPHAGLRGSQCLRARHPVQVAAMMPLMLHCCAASQLRMTAGLRGSQCLRARHPVQVDAMMPLMLHCCAASQLRMTEVLCALWTAAALRSCSRHA